MPTDTSPLMPRWAWRTLFWCLVAVVTVLMLLPNPPQAAGTGWDKADHVLAFAAPTVAGLAGLHRWRLPAIARLCAGLLAWGAAIEWLQSMLPPRQGDAADWLADVAGVAVGLLLYAAWRRAIISGRR